MSNYPPSGDRTLSNMTIFEVLQISDSSLRKTFF